MSTFVEFLATCLCSIFPTVLSELISDYIIVRKTMSASSDDGYIIYHQGRLIVLFKHKRRVFDGVYVSELLSNKTTLAALMIDGRVITYDYIGGDIKSVQTDFKKSVDNVYSTDSAFAAKFSDGTVATWGDRNHGGDSSLVQAYLKDVGTIYSNQGAFAAETKYGIVTWGDRNHGGDSSSVQAELKNGVDTIRSTDSTFAALLSDGSVVVWGDPDSGWNPKYVKDLNCVKKLYSNDCSFAALLSDGSVVVWGHHIKGGLEVITPDTPADIIYSNYNSFAIKLKNGDDVITCGDPESGGDSKSVELDIYDSVDHIYTTGYAYLAKLTPESIFLYGLKCGYVAWGDTEYGGDRNSIPVELNKGVVCIYSNVGAFVALLSDGTVVAWGHPDYGGDCSLVQSLLNYEVVVIVPSDIGFAAVLRSGDIVTWGKWMTIF